MLRLTSASIGAQRAAYIGLLDSSQWVQQGSILQYVRDCLGSFQKFSLMAIFIPCVRPWHRHKTSSRVAIVNTSNINIFTIALLFCCSMNKTSGLQCRKWWILESYSPYSNYSSAREIMMLNGQLTKDWTHNVLLFRWNIAHLQQWRRWSPFSCRFFRNLFTPQPWFITESRGNFSETWDYNGSVL